MHNKAQFPGIILHKVGSSSPTTSSLSPRCNHLFLGPSRNRGSSTCIPGVCCITGFLFCDELCEVGLGLGGEGEFLWGVFLAVLDVGGGVVFD